MLGELLATPRLRAELAAGARPHANRFSWARTTDELVAAYAEAVVDLHSEAAAR